MNKSKQTTPTPLGKILTEALALHGMNKRGLALRIGLSESGVGGIISGRINPSARTIKKLAHALSIDHLTLLMAHNPSLEFAYLTMNESAEAGEKLLVHIDDDRSALVSITIIEESIYPLEPVRRRKPSLSELERIVKTLDAREYEVQQLENL